MSDWIIQLICNFLFSGIVSGVVVAVVKARMENYYSRKHEEDKKAETRKYEYDREETQRRRDEIKAVKDEVILVKGRVNQVAERLSFVKENVAVVISKLDSQDDRISELNESVKNIQNFGKVRVVK